MLNARSHGFTMVELMIAIAVLAMLLAAGAPAMRIFVENGRIRAAGESWKYGLGLARAEAVRLNTRVDFVMVDSDDFRGWQVQRASDDTVLHQASGKEGLDGLTLTIEPEGADRVTFDPFGRSLDPTSEDTEPMTQVDIAAARPPDSSNYKPLRLQLLAGGMSRLCDPNAEADDPRACL